MRATRLNTDHGRCFVEKMATSSTFPLTGTRYHPLCYELASEVGGTPGLGIRVLVTLSHPVPPYILSPNS